MDPLVAIGIEQSKAGKGKYLGSFVKKNHDWAHCILSKKDVTPAEVAEAMEVLSRPECKSCSE